MFATKTAGNAALLVVAIMITDLEFRAKQATGCRGGFLSEKSGGFLLVPSLQKNIPFYYTKLLHPVHGIDKISMVKKLTFTGSKSRF